MEPRGSLQLAQEPTTCLCPESDRSSPCPHPTSRRSILILFPHLHLGLSSDFFRHVFPPKPCMDLSPIRATYPSHLSVLDLITRIMFCEAYRAGGNVFLTAVYPPWRHLRWQTDCVCFGKSYVFCTSDKCEPLSAGYISFLV